MSAGAGGWSAGRSTVRIVEDACPGVLQEQARAFRLSAIKHVYFCGCPQLATNAGGRDNMKMT